LYDTRREVHASLPRDEDKPDPGPADPPTQAIHGLGQDSTVTVQVVEHHEQPVLSCQSAEPCPHGHPDAVRIGDRPRHFGGGRADLREQAVQHRKRVRGGRLCAGVYDRNLVVVHTARQLGAQPCLAETGLADDPNGIDCHVAPPREQAAQDLLPTDEQATARVEGSGKRCTDCPTGPVQQLLVLRKHPRMQIAKRWSRVYA
jgi:hypothetical protein